jgi:hypothetical protein
MMHRVLAGTAGLWQGARIIEIDVASPPPSLALRSDSTKQRPTQVRPATDHPLQEIANFLSTDGLKRLPNRAPASASGSRF